MELTVIVLVVFLQIVGLAIFARMVKRMLDQQYQTVRLLSVMKKAENTGDAAHLMEMTEDPDLARAKEIAAATINEQQLLPDELPPEALNHIREQM